MCYLSRNTTYACPATHKVIYREPSPLPRLQNNRDQFISYSRPDWGADEELQLIKGAQTLGLGNWQDIAEHIGSRDKEEVKEHYLKYYLESSYYPIPDITQNIHVPQDEFLEQRRHRIESFRERPLEPPRKPMASVPSCHEVQGFMPGRLEFETEFENEAEGPVKDMVFEPDDQPLDIELKFAIWTFTIPDCQQEQKRKGYCLITI